MSTGGSTPTNADRAHQFATPSGARPQTSVEAVTADRAADDILLDQVVTRFDVNIDDPE
jgi:hypothetical protein